jgi:hypothetical protein
MEEIKTDHLAYVIGGAGAGGFDWQSMLQNVVGGAMKGGQQGGAQGAGQGALQGVMSSLGGSGSIGSMLGGLGVG